MDSHIMLFVDDAIGYSMEVINRSKFLFQVPFD